MSAVPTQFIPGDSVKLTAKILIWIAVAMLILYSVLGTFYYLLERNAPMFNLAQVYKDVVANSPMLWGAIAIQFVLSVLQYAGRLFAIDNPKFWVLYIIALSASVVCNIESYYTPLSNLITAYAAVPLIIVADIAPEFLLIKH